MGLYRENAFSDPSLMKGLGLRNEFSYIDP